MECEGAELLLMKYMDNTLAETETDPLNAHLESCGKCRGDFMIYDEILRELSHQTVYAPDNFEALVMDVIRKLPSDSKKFMSSADNLLCVVWGIFSVLFGLGFLAVMNRESIIGYLSDNPSLKAYADFLIPVSRFADAAAASLMSAADTLVTDVSAYISSSRYILMLIVGVLIMVQYVIYKKNKAEA